jgi:hypothetical protein
VLAFIDRFEGDLAILEVDGQERPVLRTTLEADAKEGDVVNLATGRVDAQETRRRHERLKDQERLAHQKSPPRGGSFNL